MSGFFKKLIFVIVVLIVINIVAGFIVYLNLTGIFSHQLTKRFGVKTTIEKVALRPSQIDIKDLKVSNPPQSKSLPYALTVNETFIDAPFTNYFKKEVVIDEVDIDSPHIYIEMYNPQNTQANWTIILHNMRNQDRSNDASSRVDKEDKKNGRSALIKLLTIRNIQITIQQYGKAPKELRPISKIELRNVSSETGIPSREITRIIVQRMLSEVFSLRNITNTLLQAPLNTPEDAVKTTGNLFKGLFGKTSPRRQSPPPKKR
ncbi:MAG: hypothetical protein S4CHLAM102_09750 [Chlamydiia bacterium]|nr:hypothetical protein [Chlamydiia bacterium]